MNEVRMYVSRPWKNSRLEVRDTGLECAISMVLLYYIIIILCYDYYTILCYIML